MLRVRNSNWFDNDCKNIIQEKNKARQIMIQRNTRSSRERYERLKRQGNKIRKKKKQAVNKEIEELERMNRKHEDKQFYAATRKRIRKGFEAKVTGCKDRNGELIGEERKVLERWVEHFEELLSKSKNQQSSTENENNNVPDEKKKEKKKRLILLI